MTQLRVALLAAPFTLALAAAVSSFCDGALPGRSHPVLGTVPNEVARAAPGCGQCHGTTSSTVKVHLTPSARSLQQGQVISMVTSSSYGLVEPMKETWGGFVTEIDRGTLTGGFTSYVSPDGHFITHNFPFNGGRNWQYSYTAPATPGLVQAWAAVLTVNGDGTEYGDMWAFHGPTGEQTTATPVRLYVNAPGVVHHGDGCVGSHGNHPVLGARETPTIGNQDFALELYGAPTGVPAVLFLGVDPRYSVNLTINGIIGCSLHVRPLLAIPTVTTTTGSSIRGDGSATVHLPLPNDPLLQGFSFQVQMSFEDRATSRPVPVTLTNALAVTVL